MRRWKWTVLAGLVVCLALVVAWRTCRTSTRSGASTSNGSSEHPIAANKHARNDARHQPRASITGTVTDDAHVHVPHARVCAELSDEQLAHFRRDPRCTNADDAGAYAINDLFAGDYLVSALAGKYLPQRLDMFELHAGERRPGVDIVLHAGGVEISGTVLDLGGGPIAHAQVEAFPTTTYQRTASIEADDNGKFRMWVWAGSLGVSADADGYSSATEWGTAPGAFELRLTPAASIAGTVFDARTHEPLPDVTVGLAVNVDSLREYGPDDTTDEHGRFRIDRVTPGRYFVFATAEHGYGRSEGSVRVGLGQHVEDATVQIHPAASVEGKVMIDGAPPSPCPKPSLFLHVAGARDDSVAHAEADGTVRVDGVLPGTYQVGVGCVDHVLREDAPNIRVGDDDVKGLMWKVVPRVVGTIRGRVLTSTGTPVVGAQVSVNGTGWADDTSKTDGSYELKHLGPGTYEATVRSDRGVPPERGWSIELAAGATITKDLVLQQGGSVAGSVTTSDDKPVADVRVLMEVAGDYLEQRSAADGSFHFENLPAGNYVAFADADGGDRRRERVTVRSAHASSVKLIVEPRPGKITGTVVGTNGQPRSDVFVKASREYGGAINTHDRYDQDRDRVLTSVAGTFAITELSDSSYSVRAFEPGGSEAIVEHVKIGATLRIQLKPSGSIAGAVHTAAGAPTDVQIRINDARTGFSREERFYRTDGRFHLDELPAGRYVLTARYGEAEGQSVVELAEGARLNSVDVTIDTSVTLKGRVVDLATKVPLSNITVVAELVGGKQHHSGVTDGEGRFEINSLPAGQIGVDLQPGDGQDYALAYLHRTVGAGTTDLGELVMAKNRYHRGDSFGRLGVTFAEDSLRIIEIEPSGPAARTALVVGDVVTSIDGIGVAGVEPSTAISLLYVPLGTTIQLGLARGVTVAVVTGPRPL